MSTLRTASVCIIIAGYLVLAGCDFAQAEHKSAVISTGFAVLNAVIFLWR